VLDFREPVQLVDEGANPNPLQRLAGTVEDDEEHKRDPADPCRGSFYSAQEQMEAHPRTSG
jgi:hypothetical protein